MTLQTRRLILERYRKGMVVYVDIDGTLIDWDDKPMIHVIDFVKALKEKRGCELIAWSGGGKDWAEHATKQLGINHLFDMFLDKPDATIDDLEFAEFCHLRVKPDELK